MKVPPFQKRPRAYWTNLSIWGLSLGLRTRAGSSKNPRAWLYSINARVGRGLSGSVPATAAGKLSSTRRLGQPWKNTHAFSSPSMVASTVWWISGHKKLWRLYVRVMLKPQIHWPRPVSGLRSRPSRSKSISATSPGGVGAIRTVSPRRPRGRHPGRHATGAGDRALRLAHLPTPYDFDHLHATQLPIAHPAHLVVADMVMNRALGGLILRGDHLA